MRTLSARQFALDLVIAAMFALVCAFLYATVGAIGGERGLLELGPTLIIAAALAVRRFSPALSLAIAWCAALVQLRFDLNASITDLGICAVLYATAAYGGRVVRWLGLGSAVGGSVVASVYLIDQRGWFGGTIYFPRLMPGQLRDFAFLFGGTMALLVLSWVSGLLMRSRRAARTAAEREEQARHDADLAEYRVVVEQERNRIARDMHDVVAHSLAVVIAQADGARFAASARPAVAVGALETISSVARDALGDVRMLLAELRHDEGSTPQPGLVDLDVLFAQLRAAGLELEVSEQGARRTLGAGHELAAYRIIQEGLTNALRHGEPGRPVSLALSWQDDGLGVELVNALRPAASTAPVSLAAQGHGLPGMHERAQLAGGTFSAGPEGGDRFVVTARIPIGAAA